MSVPVLRSAPANEAPPPQAWRRYVLGAELGRGGCGVVHEAWDTLLQRDVAIKRLAQGRSSESALREARLTARVQHPAIVAVHEVFQDDDAAQVVMEIVRGRTGTHQILFFARYCLPFIDCQTTLKLSPTFLAKQRL